MCPAGTCAPGYNPRLIFRETPWKPNASTLWTITSPISPGGATNCGGIFDFDAKAEKLEELSQALEDPKVWDDAERAQALGRDKKAAEGVVLTLRTFSQQLADTRELFDLARGENDDDTLGSVENDIDKLEELVAGLEFRRMFANPLDPNNCFIDIQSGAGGTEAQDWAAMLLRMYLRYCERKGYAVEVLEQSDGEVAGIKTATLKINGDYAYGYLRTESGIHRLVRKSPFD